MYICISKACLGNIRHRASREGVPRRRCYQPYWCYPDVTLYHVSLSRINGMLPYIYIYIYIHMYIWDLRPGQGTGF